MRTSEPSDGSVERNADPIRWLRDKNLVASALRGDASSQDEVARRMDCIPIFLGELNRRAGSPISGEDLDDQARNVAMTVWQRLSTFEGAAKFETWVYRFCELTISNAVRRRPRVAVRLDTTEEPADANEEPATLAKDEARVIREAVERLRDDEASVLKLRYFEDLKLEQIAQRLGVTVHVVKRTHVRALKRLEVMLGSGFFPEGS